MDITQFFTRSSFDTEATDTSTSASAQFTVPKAKSEYMIFKNNRVKEIIENSKQSGTIYPGVLNKREAGRIAKFEWDRDNGKFPFKDRWCGVGTNIFKEMINKIFPEFSYPMVTEIPPVTDRKKYRAFAYDYTLGMCVDFFTKFTTIFTSFEEPQVETTFFKIKKYFKSQIRRSSDMVSTHSSYVFPPWIQDRETERNEEERFARVYRRRTERIERFHRDFIHASPSTIAILMQRDALERLREEGVPNQLLEMLTRNPRTRFYTYHAGNGNIGFGFRESEFLDLTMQVRPPAPPKAKLMPEHIKKDIVRLKKLVGEELDDCPICLCELDSDFVITHCGHAYCKVCMDGLLKSSIERSSGKVCAVCRENILA